MNNLVNTPAFEQLQQEMETKLTAILVKSNDAFLPGIEYTKKWGYFLDKSGGAPYSKINFQGLPINE